MLYFQSTKLIGPPDIWISIIPAGGQDWMGGMLNSKLNNDRLTSKSYQRATLNSTPTARKMKKLKRFMHKVLGDKNIQKDEILYDSGILPNRWKTLLKSITF